MINLFSFFRGNINSTQFKNLIYDDIVDQLEEELSKYIGVKYVALLNNATTAITLALQRKYYFSRPISIPSILPPVVANAIKASDNFLNFLDNIDWVGSDYYLDKDIIDSAHRLDKNQFFEYKNDDIVIFSFYPTKVLGGWCGSAIVSNNKDKINWFKEKIYSGKNPHTGKQHTWGHNHYLITPQVYVIWKQLQTLDERKEKIAEIRKFYNEEFGYSNTSDHLYRINVKNNKQFIEYMRKNGVICGIHYKALHKNKIYHPFKVNVQLNQFPKSEKEERTTVSIPMHHELSNDDVKKITQLVINYK